MSDMGLVCRLCRSYVPCISERGTLSVQALLETDCRVGACEGRRNMVEMSYYN